MKPDARHPEVSTLALLAGGDVAWWESLATRWHVPFCPQCKRQIAQFRSARMELAQADSDTAWSALEAEMRANIRLGLTAGSLAVGPTASEDVDLTPLPLAPWRWAVVCGAMAFVLTAGWWLRSPGGALLPTASTPGLQTPLSEQASQGAGMRAGIQLLAPVANVSRTETDFDGSTRSRVIDGETGQVTLQQVYVE